MFRRHAIVALLLLGMVMAGVLDTSADAEAKPVKPDQPDESKPVLDTAVEAAMRSRGISPFSASRWEAQGLPQLMEAHDAVTQKLLKVQPRVGDLYSKIPEFKMPDEKMKVPELANDNTVPNPQLGYYDPMGYFVPTLDTGGVSSRMVDTSRNVNPGTQAMPIGFDFPPKMATLPAAETVQGGIQPGSVAAVAILTGRANKTEA